MGLLSERRAQVVVALAELADGCTTAADVARKLTEAGCKGDRSDCATCPIAQWLLKKLTGDRLTVTVMFADAAAAWESEATYGDPIEPPVYETVFAVDMPPVLGAFVEAFDGGEFCELRAEAGQ